VSSSLFFKSTSFSSGMFIEKSLIVVILIFT
jgi:hypothetical protein